MYDKWQKRIQAQFEADHPTWAADAHKIEVCEDGSIYVFCGGAYPAIFSGYEPWTGD